MGLFSHKPSSFPWISLDSMEQLNEIFENEETALLFKHSTRCSISSMALNRFEKEFTNTATKCYFLDLIAHRDLSNEIAVKSGIHHESPQVIVLKNKQVIHDSSHHQIDALKIQQVLAHE